MSVRDEVLELVDELTEEELSAVERYIQYLRSGSTGDPLTWVLDHAPLDDEPTTAEDVRQAEEAWQEYVQGDALAAEEAKRLLRG